MKKVGIYFILLFTSSILFAPSRKIKITIEDSTNGVELKRLKAQMVLVKNKKGGYLRAMVYYKGQFQKSRDTLDVVKYFLAYNSLTLISWENPKTVKRIKKTNAAMFSLCKQSMVETSNDQSKDAFVLDVAPFDIAADWSPGNYQI